MKSPPPEGKPVRENFEIIPMKTVRHEFGHLQDGAADSAGRQEAPREVGPLRLAGIGTFGLFKSACAEPNKKTLHPQRRLPEIRSPKSVFSLTGRPKAYKKLAAFQI